MNPALTLTAPGWEHRAACRGADGEIFFPVAAPNTGTWHAQAALALAYCDRCRVRLQCLAAAIDGGIDWGIWGGTTPEERRTALRGAA